MQQGRAISLFLFLLVSVLSLLISVMSLVLSWNSSTERSEGEVFHGFYVLIWKGVRIWKQARILKGVRSCHEIASPMSWYGKGSEYGKASGPVMTLLDWMQQGRAISLFLFLLVSVLSLLISVMSLVLSWNSLTECSKGEQCHGFYFILSLSCQDMGRGQVQSWNSLTEHSNGELLHSFFSFCLCLWSYYQ